MKIETRHSSCMINFSVCQTLSITQGEEVLSSLYFYFVPRFYSTQTVVETVNWKIALEWIIAENFAICCLKILSKKCLNLTSPLQYLWISFTTFLSTLFRWKMFLKRLPRDWVSVCHYQFKVRRKASQLPYDFFVVLADVKKKLWRQQRKYYTDMYF